MARKPHVPKSLDAVIRMLSNCIQEVRSGQLVHRDAAAIAKLAAPLIQAVKLRCKDPVNQKILVENMTDEELEAWADISGN